MRSYQVIIILISSLFLANCSATTSSMTTNLKETEGSFINMNHAPVSLEDGIIGAAPGFMWNASQYMRFSLNKTEKNLHRSAVYHALNETANGKVTYWYSKTRNAMGQVRVVHSYPTSAGYCRVYQSFIKLNGATRHMTNNACKMMEYPWRFVK